MNRLALAVVGICLVFPGSAGAAVINFDDLSTGTLGTPITGGYAGLNWQNFYYADAEVATSLTGWPGYENGLVSPGNIAFNGFGDPAEVSGSVFTLDSGYFTSAYSEPNLLLVEGFRLGSLLYTREVDLVVEEPIFVTFGWSGIDRVRFTTHGVAGSSHVVIDDLSITGTVPDGGLTVILLGIALGGLGWFRRRLG